jgi:hypothetical protein
MFGGAPGSADSLFVMAALANDDSCDCRRRDLVFAVAGRTWSATELMNKRCAMRLKTVRCNAN